MSCTPGNKRILIECPSEVKNSWGNVPNGIFETFDPGDGNKDYLVLYPSPIGGWVQRNNYVTSEPSLLFSSRTSLLQVAKANRIFEASIGDCKYELLGILEELSGNSNSAAISTYTPIKFIDFATFEFTDFKQSSVDTFTERNGVLVLTDRGTIIGYSGQQQFVKGGFKFKFIETSLRVI